MGTIRLNVTDRDGATHMLDVTPNGTLMEALRELEYGVTAICGGTCACATCHIYVAPDWIPRVPPQQEDEWEMIQELDSRGDASRLACQIPLCESFDGLSVVLAPEE